MSVTTGETSTTSTTSEKRPIVVSIEKTPFYKTFSFWIIFISIIIFIVIGFIIFFQSGNEVGGFFLIGFYAFAIIFLIIGMFAALS